jgi:hypothetical protein
MGDGAGRQHCIFEGWKPMHGQSTLVSCPSHERCEKMKTGQ